MRPIARTSRRRWSAADGLLKEAIDDITARGGGLRMSENLPRDALYDRDALR